MAVHENREGGLAPQQHQEGGQEIGGAEGVAAYHNVGGGDA